MKKVQEERNNFTLIMNFLPFKKDLSPTNLSELKRETQAKPDLFYILYSLDGKQVFTIFNGEKSDILEFEDPKGDDEVIYYENDDGLEENDFKSVGEFVSKSISFFYKMFLSHIVPCILFCMCPCKKRG